jgi:hypothetical protein
MTDFTQRWYVLDENKNPIPASAAEANAWLADLSRRQVGRFELEGWEVSTVFLALDHNLRPGGKPLLFETMVFSPASGWQDTERYHSWAEAELGHQTATDRIRLYVEVANRENQNLLERLMGKTR